MGGDKNKEIQMKRQESFLKQIVSEAFSNLDDSRLNRLVVTRVRCPDSRSHAKVFIESSQIDDRQKQQVLKAYKGAQGVIKNYLLQMSGWRRAPDIKLIFEDELATYNRLDSIFKSSKRDDSQGTGLE